MGQGKKSQRLPSAASHWLAQRGISSAFACCLNRSASSSSPNPSRGAAPEEKEWHSSLSAEWQSRLVRLCRHSSRSASPGPTGPTTRSKDYHCKLVLAGTSPTTSHVLLAQFGRSWFVQAKEPGRTRDVRHHRFLVASDLRRVGKRTPTPASSETVRHFQNETGNCF